MILLFFVPKNDKGFVKARNDDGFVMCRSPSCIQTEIWKLCKYVCDRTAGKVVYRKGFISLVHRWSKNGQYHCEVIFKIIIAPKFKVVNDTEF